LISSISILSDASTKLNSRVNVLKRKHNLLIYIRIHTFDKVTATNLLGILLHTHHISLINGVKTIDVKLTINR
jgi:hypothetical protein